MRPVEDRSHLRVYIKIPEGRLPSGIFFQLKGGKMIAIRMIGQLY